MTAVQVQTKIDAYSAAIDFVLTGSAQSMSQAGRSLTTLPLGVLESGLAYWESRLAAATAGSVRPGVIRFGRPA